MTQKHKWPKFSDSYNKYWLDRDLWSDITLHDAFDKTVAKFGSANAIITEAEHFSFNQFKGLSDALAAGLLDIGIEPGDIVAVLMPNWVEFCLLQIALSRIGAVIQPSHTVFRERELTNLYNFCETDAVVVADSFRDYSLADLVRRIKQDIPGVKNFIIARADHLEDGEFSLENIIDRGRNRLHLLKLVKVSPRDVFYLNFTSGTEGNPKGFLHTHNTLLSMLKKVGDVKRRVTPDVINLSCSPMTHTYGHITTYYCALSGIPAVLVDRYHPKEVLKLIERERVTDLAGTPAHLIGILNFQNFNKYDTSSIRTVGVGGARSAPELIKELEEVWGVKTGNTYGMGETIIHTCTVESDPEEKIKTTVGRPINGAELKIVDQKNRDRTLSSGVVGEVCFRGPTLFVGYHNQPELTAQTRDDDGWFYTSDLGMLDEDGYLIYVGRSKEVINRGGTKIYPKEIEDILYSIPVVRDAAVVGMPDERFGEIVCAYIVPEGERQVSLEMLKEYLMQMKMTKYMFPDRVINVGDLPMTPTGKVQKVLLAKDAENRAKEGR